MGFGVKVQLPTRAHGTSCWSKELRTLQQMLSLRNKTMPHCLLLRRRRCCALRYHSRSHCSLKKERLQTSTRQQAIHRRGNGRVRMRVQLPSQLALSVEAVRETCNVLSQFAPSQNQTCEKVTVHAS